eukprot:403355899
MDPYDNNRASYDIDNNNPNNDQQERGTANNDLDFNSFYQRKFEQSNAGNPMLAHSGGNDKQLFTNITVNIFVPKDPNIITPTFNLIDILDDEPEKFEKLQYFCEVPDYTTAKVLLLKSLDNFEAQLATLGSAVVLQKDDLSKFSLKIGRKKNGQPKEDFPSVDLSQNIVDVDFTIFCVVYTHEGILNQLTTSTQSNQTTKSGQSKQHQQKTNQTPGTLKEEGGGYASMSLQNNSYINNTLATETGDGTGSNRGIMANAPQNQQQQCHCMIF